MSKNQKGVRGVPRRKNVGSRVTGVPSPKKATASRPSTRSRATALPPLAPGAICRMDALSGFQYAWIGKYARVVRCYPSAHTRSKLSVDFEPIDWFLLDGHYIGWDRAWFTQVLPALAIGGAAQPVGNPTEAKRTTGKRGPKATPKPHQ